LRHRNPSGELGEVRGARARSLRVRKPIESPGNASPRVLRPRSGPRALRQKIGPATQLAISKNMNASAFSCGVSGSDEQLFGNGVLGELSESPDTCMSLNTTLPQRSFGCASCGVVNWNICGYSMPFCGQ